MKKLFIALLAGASLFASFSAFQATSAVARPPYCDYGTRSC